MDLLEKFKLSPHKIKLMVGMAAVLIILLGLFVRGLWRSDPVAIDPITDPPQAVTPPEDPEVPPPVVIIPELPGAFVVAMDNKAEARPHTGLEKADLVYEVLAEWRITRFLAFFYTKEVPVIGPVRSARYYTAQIVAPYRAPFAHAGGTTDGLQFVHDLRIPDLDEIYNSEVAFWRDRSRVAPHNLYTSTERMYAQSQRRNLKMNPLPEMTVGSMVEGVGTDYLKIIYSVRNPSLYLINYQVEWKWDNGAYTRYMNDKPHATTDGVDITANNIIVVSVTHRDIVANGAWRTEMDLTGGGEALFLRDGVSYSGTWKKATAHDHFEFMVDGQVYNFAPGNTWIQIVPGMDVVSIN